MMRRAANVCQDFSAPQQRLLHNWAYWMMYLRTYQTRLANAA